MKRRQAREAALCMLFDYGFHEDEKPDDLLDLYLSCFYDKKEKCIREELREDKYFTKVYFGVLAELPKIDEIIEKCSEKWKKDRISRISISILRIAIYEMLCLDDIPHEVSINEAVELAKRFDTDDSYTFVNGVLGAAHKMMIADEPTAAAEEEKNV